MNEHYKKLAQDFNKVWKFSDDYKVWAVEKIGYYLKLNNSDTFVDIGGGTGSFTDMISKSFSPYKAYCVEPEESMCEIAKNYSTFTTVCSDTFHFLNTLKYKYSKMLFKEVIHHIDNRNKLWNDIFNTIEDEGKILIYTRPQNIKFPLFQKAKDEFFKNQPHYDFVVNELKDVGFSVEVSIKSFTFELSKEEWFTMLKAKFMSDLSVFSDEEIIEGIKELDDKYDSDTFIIEDEIVFITAYK